MLYLKRKRKDALQLKRLTICVVHDTKSAASSGHSARAALQNSSPQSKVPSLFVMVYVWLTCNLSWLHLYPVTFRRADSRDVSWFFPIIIFKRNVSALRLLGPLRKVFTTTCYSTYQNQPDLFCIRLCVF